MKKVVFLTVLLVLFAGLAVAQRPSPTLTIQEQNLPASGAQVGTALPQGGCPNGDCLFYGGDGDPSNINANGLWDNNSSFFNIDGQVYSPFLWTKGAKCGGKCAYVVDNLVANIEFFPFPPTINSVKWAIVQGVAAGGSPASVTTICSGNDTSPVLTDTGRLYFGFYEEFAVAPHVAGCSIKGKGKTGVEYWMLIQPQTGPGEQLAYMSNVPDVPAPNAIGNPEPPDDSWFYGPAFGISTFVNANTQGAFHLFSDGLCGALGK